MTAPRRYRAGKRSFAGTRFVRVGVALGLLVVRPSAAAAQRDTRPAGTLVVSNMNDHTATLLDAGTGRVLATLPTGRGPHEVAVSRDGRWALVTNYGERGAPGTTITVIDVPRVQVARTIDLGEYRRPHGAAFLPGDTTFVVTSEVGGVVLLVDFRDGRVLRALPSRGRATHMLAVSSDGHRLVAANIADATITSLDPLAPTEPTVIHVARQPEGIALAPDGRTAWAGSNADSVVLVVDLATGTPVDTLRGFGLPYRIAFSRDGRRVAVSDPVKGEVRLFDGVTRQQRGVVQIPRDSLVATAEVPGSPSPEGVVMSPDGRWAFVTLQGRNRVAIIDVNAATVVGYGVTGNWSDGIGYSTLSARR